MNLAIVWTLTGFWHGANWTFLAWGAYNGALLMAERALDQRPVGDDAVKLRAVRRICTLVLIVVGWVLFRSSDMTQAVDFLGAMMPVHLGSPAGALDIARRQDLLFLAIGLASFLLPARFLGWRLVSQATGRAPGVARFGLFAVVLPCTVLTMASGSFSPFLYFRF